MPSLTELDQLITIKKAQAYDILAHIEFFKAQLAPIDRELGELVQQLAPINKELGELLQQRSLVATESSFTPPVITPTEQ